MQERISNSYPLSEHVMKINDLLFTDSLELLHESSMTFHLNPVTIS